MAQSSAAHALGGFAILYGDLTIDNDPRDAGRGFEGFVECGAVDDLGWVEHRDVGEVVEADVAPFGETEDVRREAAGAADGLLQGQHLLADGVEADLARERAEAAG